MAKAEDRMLLSTVKGAAMTDPMLPRTVRAAAPEAEAAREVQAAKLSTQEPPR
jgi:hypothetical protein